MSNRKRILFTIPNFKTAGSKYVLLHIMERLDTTIFEPWVLVEKFQESIPSIIPPDRQLCLKRKGTLSYIRKLAKLLKKNRIDLVHSWDYKSTSLEAIGSKVAGVPYIYTKKNNSWSKRWFAKSLLSKHIAYDNPEMKERFFSHPLLTKKISFIPHGVDASEFKPMVKKEKRVEFRIGNIGVIGPNKNQLFLIKALKELPSHFVVWLYGREDESYGSMLRSYVKEHGLEERVQFKGYVSNAEMPEVLNRLDVLVLASHQEGLPLTLLEAMACEVPVITTDSGGGARYIISQGGGWLIDGNTCEDLVDKLKKLENNEALRSELGTEGRQIVQSRFTVENEVTSYEVLYKSLLDNA